MVQSDIMLIQRALDSFGDGVTKQISQLQTSVNTLTDRVMALDKPGEKHVTATEAADNFVGELTGLNPDVPALDEGFEDDGEFPVTEVPPALAGFDAERLITTTYFNRIHSHDSARGAIEFKPEGLRYLIDEAVKALPNEKRYALFNDYLSVFMKKRKFENRSFKSKYSEVNFRGLNSFMAAASIALNKLINAGLTVTV